MSKNNLWYLPITLVILLGLFLFLRPKNSPTAQIIPQVKTFNLVIKNKKRIFGPNTIKVNQGDRVAINFTSNQDEELHVHGYDMKMDLTANKTVQLDFTANLTGHFPYELEHSKTEIGTLEVQPK